MDSLHFRKFWDYLASLPNSLRTQERHCCNSKCHQQTHNISITWKLRNAESQVPPQNYWSRSCNWTKSPGDSHKQWDLRITVRVESGFPRRTEPVGCVCVCVCVCVYKWRERERFILKLWLLWPWGLETEICRAGGKAGNFSENWCWNFELKAILRQDSFFSQGPQSFLFRPSIDGMRSTHTMKENLLYAKSTGSSVSHI